MSAKTRTCSECRRALPRQTFGKKGSVCYDCLQARSTGPPQQPQPVVIENRFFLSQEDNAQYPILAHAASYAAMFIESDSFLDLAIHLLTEIANELFVVGNLKIDRLIATTMARNGVQAVDLEFLRGVIEETRSVRISMNCSKSCFMEANRNQNAIFVNPAYQRELNSDALLFIDILKILHEFAQLLSSKLICYAEQVPHDPDRPTPPRIGNKRKSPQRNEGDAGYLIEESLTCGRVFPEGKSVKLEKMMTLDTLNWTSYSISEEWLGMFAAQVSEGKTTMAMFRTSGDDLTPIQVDSKKLKASKRTRTGPQRSSSEDLDDLEDPFGSCVRNLNHTFNTL
eukprot:TRINITY_DN31404_c0_g2_i1.p1 TRINITY_DN31404_c0_g2~~TRINITY_DN31404_c0_g2_i1.p1  ORF type:complete len:340 (-),score=67.20 TRINITY_DN31404_c0_g2_i1:43-1062(-)